MGRIVDLTGMKFGRLTVVSLVEKNEHRNHKWKCICECGNEVYVFSGNLKKGVSSSCGCYNKEITSKRNIELEMGKRVSEWINENKEIHYEKSINSILGKNNTSGVKGISWSGSRLKWEASITINHKKINLGRFDNKEIAIAARKSAEIKYWGKEVNQ